jgi:pyruvate dehydrogenase E2 component (dihydrolipoamide acetyltransferase)
MRTEVIMPRMGQGMEEGVILKWLKPVGAAVKRGEPLIEIESDKATVEIEAFATGKLIEILVPEGSTAPIGTILGMIEVESAGQPPSPPPAASAAPMFSTPPPPALLRVNSSASVSPVAQRLAQEHQLDLVGVAGSGPGGRITKSDVEAAVAARRPPARLDVSPLARRLAREYGLNLREIRGSAPNGRIIKRDILAAQPATGTPAQPNRSALSKLRRMAAVHMVESKLRIPHFYLTLDVDMDRARLLRESLKRRGHTVSLNDLVLKAAALALAEYPTLNATHADDDLHVHEQVNLAIAVAVGERAHPEGLITPVIHGCQALRLVEIAERSAAVAGRARSGKLKPDDLDGGTFTISNLGMFGILQFQAIINPPQVAILAVGALQKLAGFDEQDRVVAVQRMTVTLSADHRATDGAEAAGFLSVFKDALEDAFVLAE